MLLILAVSESEPAELPRFSTARSTGPQPSVLAAPGLAVCVVSQGFGTGSGGQLQGGSGSQQHSPAEPPRAKPQALLPAKFSPFNLPAQPGVAKDS